jgi:hypothetical protein
VGLVQLRGQSGQQGFGIQRGAGVLGRPHVSLDRAMHLLRQVVTNVADRVELMPSSA